MQRICFSSLFFASACSLSDESIDQPCSGSVDAVANVEGDEVTVTGNFLEGQPILVITGGGGSRKQFTADASDTTYARYIALPSGIFQTEWLLSCHDNTGPANIDGPSSIHVP